MIRVLCFGDSNTWGYISGSDHKRYNENERWPKLLQQQLGKDYEVIEEGLNSRTYFSEDKRLGKEGKAGYPYLKPCLETHDKLDIVVLMLGTNELKYAYNNTANDVLKMFEKFVQFIFNFKSQIDGSTPKLIVSGIPLVASIKMNETPDDKYFQAPKKSKELCELYKKYCLKNHITYIDNTDLELGIDAIHITLESHKKLAQKVFQEIKNAKID